MTKSAKSKTVPLDPSREECSICLQDFTTQEVGIPGHCKHAFCFTCLCRWTKEESTCPHDRQEIHYILRKSSYSSRKPYAIMNMKDGTLEAYVEESTVYCEECGDNDEDYPLVTCSKCQHNYHSFCLNASDTKAWICPSCGGAHGKASTVRRETVNKPVTSQRAKQQRIKTSVLQNKDTAKSRGRSQQSPLTSLRRQIENSSTQSTRLHNGMPSRSATLASQARSMAALKNKRKRLSYLPARLPMTQLPRIKRRVGAPSRPQVSLPKSKLTANASFIDKLLHAQNSLHSLSHVRMQGANIQLS